jgi:hypothetical protein
MINMNISDGDEYQVDGWMKCIRVATRAGRAILFAMLYPAGLETHRVPTREIHISVTVVRVSPTQCA